MKGCVYIKAMGGLKLLSNTSLVGILREYTRTYNEYVSCVVSLLLLMIYSVVAMVLFDQHYCVCVFFFIID